MTKKAKVSAAFFLVLFLGSGYAEEKGAARPGGLTTEVSVRSSRHEGFLRIVFEGTDESFMKNVSVISAQGKISVQFPEAPRLTTKGNLDVEASLTGKTYVIKPAEPFTIKVLRLASPPRISVDIVKAAKEEAGKTTAPEGAHKKEEGRKAQTEGVPAEVFPNVRVALDPGHGGYDVGILSGELREKDLTLAVAKDIEAALVKRKRPVFLTRKSDQFLSIADRAASVSQRPPDIFISVHLSMSGNFVLYTFPAEQAGAEPTATEVYSLISRQRRFVEKSKSLAESLGKTVKAEFKEEILQRDMELPLLGFVGAPAVLIEVPAPVVQDKAMRAKLSEAVLKGIAAYAGR